MNNQNLISLFQKITKNRTLEFKMKDLDSIESMVGDKFKEIRGNKRQKVS